MGSEEGPETGRERGDDTAGASVSDAPHSLQNLADKPASWPQRGQLLDSLAPHASQKLAPEGFSNPQFAQRIRPPPLPGAFYLTLGAEPASGKTRPVETLSPSPDVDFYSAKYFACLL